MTITERFIHRLKTDTTNPYLSSIYLSLFKILSEESLFNILNYLWKLQLGKDKFFKEEGKTHWFVLFHKMIRQVDFFENCYVDQTLELLTLSEKEELYYLKYSFLEKKETKFNGSEMTEKYKRYLSLLEKQRREKIPVSICGNLDNILWNVIHKDNGLLKETFEYAFGSFDEKN